MKMAVDTADTADTKNLSVSGFRINADSIENFGILLQEAIDK
jgi:hypothetical protein